MNYKLETDINSLLNDPRKTETQTNSIRCMVGITNLFPP